ncbi:M6 family metalloprotease domain-containing protein [Aeromonas salmonicida]|uniref:M6 family metalloprotease domain-containing protein n=1 Tax=Aeromonas salmonicida TaxID=645 RepID=UPI001EE0EA72|nr:M6 family metalloprotease domain-containing protein [Aeromonas salmonicida]
MKNGRAGWLNILTIIGSVMFAVQTEAAVPYVNYHHTVTQPDGSTLELILNGSTLYADQRTKDGYPVIYDNTLKGYAYAKLSENEEMFESTGILVTESNGVNTRSIQKDTDIPQHAKRSIVQRNARQLQVLQYQAQSPKISGFASQYANVTGNVRGLTILIQFPDESSSIPSSEVINYTNQIGYTGHGNAQSIRDYFRAVSGNKLDYTNTVVGYYTAKKYKSYYTDPTITYGARARELIVEALDWLEYTEGFDFSTISKDSNGNIRGLNVFYSGSTGGGWAQGLWPHQGGLNRWCADGLCASKYQISNMDSNLSIGTFIHESGHLLFGWPDLYDYDGSSGGSAGSHCIMGYGGVTGNRHKKPVPPNGYFRSLSGWETITELNPAVNSNAPSGLLSHQANSNTLYRWSNPDKAGEAFYIETRIQAGQNQYMPGQGLIVWHVDPDGSNNNEWYPYVQMEHADGNRDPEKNTNLGDTYDMYHASGQDTFGDTQPNALSSQGTNSRWWSGADSGLELTNISAISSRMTFYIGGEGNSNQENYSGYLSGKGVSHIIPNGSWFQYDGGTLYGVLTGPGNADFDLSLEKWQNSTWISVATSTSVTSNEAINYVASSGYYRFKVYSYNGEGNYDFTLRK